jgi:hypothetical protein
MDDKVKAVLAAYYARLRDEEKARREAGATGAGDGLAIVLKGCRRSC